MLNSVNVKSQKIKKFEHQAFIPINENVLLQNNVKRCLISRPFLFIIEEKVHKFVTIMIFEYRIFLLLYNFLKQEVSILYAISPHNMLYIKNGREGYLLVCCLTSFQTNGHQHLQDLVQHSHDRLTFHLMQPRKYPHQDGLLESLLPLLEHRRYTLI